ncbi:HAD family hydrolase [Halomontanus rarus]|uniref:HAD family hydrolase n=1 Tax=Halomontanus rarus TaxID=3034020 RepID=UPI0023E7E651|nr:HAD family hydrolase [Halovivax sp. TS33]
MDNIDAVCFDLDGTLCVDDQSDEEIHEAVFDRVEAPEFFDLDDLYAVDYGALPEANSDREHHENVYRAIAQNVGADPSCAPALAEATLEVLDSTAVSFRDGAKEALEYTREKYAVGLITAGTEEAQLPKLETLGVQDAFDVTVCCGPGTGIKSKPDPEPFEIAVNELGVSLERSIYVGNRHDGDVVAPNVSGCRLLGCRRKTNLRIRIQSRRIVFHQCTKSLMSSDCPI